MAIAGVFPGQGSQSIGMMNALAESFSIVKETFEEASECLDKDLWSMLEQGAEDLLNATENTQPIMLSAGIATWRVWQQQDGCLPVGMAGHSLGEYSALVASEKLDFIDALQLVSKRAQFMQSAVKSGEGAMAAILGLSDAEVVAVCQEVTTEQLVVEAVNFNSPGQVVIAGHAAGIDQAIKVAKNIGAKRAIKLTVSVPSHCSLMKKAAEQLQTNLDATTFTMNDMPVIHNADVNYHHSAEAIRTALSQQLFQAVRWVDSVKHLKAEWGADKLVEFGPGKVLFGLNRRIDRKMTAVCITDAASLDKALAFCQQ
jgi:[acyl-carrier-protein] S-malonyltransferase